MPTRATVVYSQDRVDPIFMPNNQLCMPVRFMPNLTVPAGTVLGQVTSASASEVQTLNWSGSGDVPTGGTFLLSIVGIDGGTYWTDDLAYNISNANLKIALDALLDDAGYDGATVTIGGGACPVDTTVTFGGTAAYKDMPTLGYDITNITSSGTATLAITATTPGVTQYLWGAYSDIASDGRQVAKAIAQRTFRTDYFGRVAFATHESPSSGTLTGAIAQPEHGVYEEAAPAWFGGIFRVSDLTGLDANGAADLGRIISGAYNSTDGLLSLR